MSTLGVGDDLGNMDSSNSGSSTLGVGDELGDMGSSSSSKFGALSRTLASDFEHVANLSAESKDPMSVASASATWGSTASAFTRL